MTRRDRSIFRLALAALAVAGCTNKKDVEYAKHSQYDADFAIVYQAALEAVRELYPNIDDAPGSGKILTAWHPVSFANQQDDMLNPQTLTSTNGCGTASATSTAQTCGTSPTAGMGGMPQRGLALKRRYIRFDVSVVGGRPWKVKVTGHASEWDPGAAMPTELRGAAKPPWLLPRTEAVQVAIYKRIKQFAIPMKEDARPTNPDDELPKTDPTAFKGVPDGAAQRLAALKDTLVKRDYGALRPQLADDLIWSLGADGSGDTAMVMWQADPATFDAMAAALAATCVADAHNERRVTCAADGARSYRLVVEPRGASWKVTSFVKPD